MPVLNDAERDLRIGQFLAKVRADKYNHSRGSFVGKALLEVVADEIESIRGENMAVNVENQHLTAEILSMWAILHEHGITTLDELKKAVAAAPNAPKPPAEAHPVTRNSPGELPEELIKKIHELDFGKVDEENLRANASVVREKILQYQRDINMMYRVGVDTLLRRFTKEAGDHMGGSPVDEPGEDGKAGGDRNWNGDTDEFEHCPECGFRTNLRLGDDGLMLYYYCPRCTPQPGEWLYKPKEPKERPLDPIQDVVSREELEETIGIDQDRIWELQIEAAENYKCWKCGQVRTCPVCKKPPRVFDAKLARFKERNDTG